MSVAGGHAKVTIREVDLSTRVPGFPGVYGAIVIPAKRGPIDSPVLVTGEAQLLDHFTPNGSVEVGFDLSYYSALAFLEQADKLWVIRAIGDNYEHGGASFGAQGLEFHNAPWSEGLEDPSTHVFSAGEAFTLFASNPGDWSDDIAVRINLWRDRETIVLGDTAGNVNPFDGAPAIGVLGGEITITSVVGTEGNVHISLVGGGTAGSEYVSHIGSDVVVTIEDEVSTQAQIATALESLDVIESADAANPANAWTLGGNGGDDDEVNLVGGLDPEQTIKVTQDFASGEPVRFSLVSEEPGDALPEGVFDNLVYYVVRVSSTEIQLTTSLQAALEGHPVVNIQDSGQGEMQLVPMNPVQEPDSIQIQVFQRRNPSVPVETWEVSREIGKTDGYGRNMYIMDVLDASRYIRATDNPLVLGQPKPQITSMYLSGGDDGDPVTDTHMIRAADQFVSEDAYRVTVLMDGGWATVPYHRKLDSIASGRNDCVACLSTPWHAEAHPQYVNKIIDYFRNNLNLGSSFSTACTPHVRITDKYNDRGLFVSPDGYQAAALSYTALNYEMWFPAAGFRRGRVRVEDLRIRFTKGEMDVLYEGGVNPIRFYPGKGIMIWGQKTLLGRPSALDRLNVRMLLIVLKPALQEAMEDFLFELNNEETWAMAKLMIDDYMETIKGRRGVSDFYTQIDSDNNPPANLDNYRMDVNLFIKPALSLEYIPFNIVLTRAGMSFQLAAQIV